MTFGPDSAALADLFRSRGFDADAAVSRAALVATAEEALRRSAGAGARWRWWVPGRIEVFGKHTDYAGGRSLLAAVPRGFAVVARERDDGVVQVIDARYGGAVTVDPAREDAPDRGWPAYVSVVARRFSRNFPGASLGADIAIASDLPRAAGLSSSSAFVVGIGMALIRRASLDARDEWQRAIRTPEDLAGYFGCVENGSTYRTLAGTGGVGTEGGSEDHTAILGCRSGMLSAFAFVPVRRLNDIAMPADWAFAIASSGVHADKAGRVRDRYNRASRAAFALLAIRNGREGHRAPSLAAAVAGEPDAGDRLQAALATVATPGFSADDLSRRLTHFLREDARVAEAADAFRTTDAGALGELARASQADAEALLGNQVPETIALVEAARACGAYAASSFGAGFGGSVWAVVSASDATRFGEVWLSTYRARHPDLTRVEWFTARPAPAVVELSYRTS